MGMSSSSCFLAMPFCHHYQISSTGLLCFCVAIITDKRNRIPMAAQPALLGAMLTAICAGFALNSGNAMNPARDLGPRLFTYFAGYGWEVFRQAQKVFAKSFLKMPSSQLQ
jgi:glycerol uptake facilitator-like aquaporin